MGSDMVNAVTNAWNGMFESTSRGVQRTANTVSELPGKASNALSSLPGTVGNWVSSTWSRAVDSTSRGLSSVVSTVSSLGGRIVGALSGAGSWLVSAGANMMRGLGNGIMGMLGWAVDQAYAAARKVKEGFLSALGIRSPSRVMRVEVGRQLLPGAMEGVKDTIPDAQRYMGAVANMLVQGFTPTVNVAAPSVHTGDVMLQADFGEGIRQAVPLIITRNPRIVAGAAAVGDRQRSGWVNTARGTVR
jgi:phage-related protein